MRPLGRAAPLRRQTSTWALVAIASTLVISGCGGSETAVPEQTIEEGSANPSEQPTDVGSPAQDVKPAGLPALAVIPEAFIDGVTGLEALEQAAAESGVEIPEGSRPLPSDLPLQDFETVLYQLLQSFEYESPDFRWAFDRSVRDTGPYVLGTNYGTHGTVRIRYSSDVLEWLAGGREGEIPDGALIIKQQGFSPKPEGVELLKSLDLGIDILPVSTEKDPRPSPVAEYYVNIQAAIDAYFADDPEKAFTTFQELLRHDLGSWAVMVRDRSVSNGGWFWANPGRSSSVDDPVTYSRTPFSDTGAGTCQRCHSSAAFMSTFASLSNIEGFEAVGSPLQFRTDESWRSNLSEFLRPAHGANEEALLALEFAALDPENASATGSDGHEPHAGDEIEIKAPPRLAPLETPLSSFSDFFPPLSSVSVPAALPGQWADHVPAQPGGAEHFVTSDNCVGCHNGLGGPPGTNLTMFAKTGPKYGDGFNVSPYGEWRWSPMGLAGRDPIFFAQIESEIAILEKAGASAETVQALVNTCLSCHGAMGQRQLALDVQAGADLDPDFSLDYFKLHSPIEHGAKPDPYADYGNLAREGISCMVCHHIDPPSEWAEDAPNADGTQSTAMLASYLMNSTTGVFPYGPADRVYGPFEDVKTKPMESFLGAEPEVAPAVPSHPDSPQAFGASKEVPAQAVPYISDSKLCGTCHAINLPNVDASDDEPLEGLSPEQQAILNAAAEKGAVGGSNPVPVPGSDLLLPFQHSIEQGTYLEWENSAFAWDPEAYATCQDCHMPSSLHAVTDEGVAVDVDELKTQIATIQDSTYPQAEHGLASEDIRIPVRGADDDSTYRRHELVGLNAFVVEMFSQFGTEKTITPAGAVDSRKIFDNVLRVSSFDPETYAANGDELAVENMQRQAREETVRLDIESIAFSDDGASLQVDVNIESLVGHKLPSGVGFRRAFIELIASRGDVGGRATEAEPSSDGAPGDQAEPFWASGRTNDAGLILDGLSDDVLATERVTGKPEPGVTYQPHYETITSSDQVQIYEELITNADGVFSTSFIHRDHHVKDNRLLPLGHLDPDSEGFAKRFAPPGKAFDEVQAFMLATRPEGEAANDPDFGPATDRIRYEIPLPPDLGADAVEIKATMYYQAIPPYYLLHRFSEASGDPDGEYTKKLYYITSLLNTKDDPAANPIKDWKLELVSARELIHTR